jgi:hypothetical protein
MLKEYQKMSYKLIRIAIHKIQVIQRTVLGPKRIKWFGVEDPIMPRYVLGPSFFHLDKTFSESLPITSIGAK